jgi:hypothetical protein
MSDITVGRHSRYYRSLEHGDFSLEANTEAVPEPDHFFVLQEGKVLLRSDDFHTAEVAYRDLCRTYWEKNLASELPLSRMASAWGLLGAEIAHRGAAKVIEQDGSVADQTRLMRMRSRQRALLARSERTARMAAR